MQYIETIGIITKKVLNEETGELESQRFREEKTRKQIKGGFRMVYKSYDDALVEIVKSGKDLETVVAIRNMFTYQRVETLISKAEVADIVGISPQKATKVIKAMLDSGMLKRVGRGAYRLNPFMYLPFRADGELLQAEWKNLSTTVEPK